VTQKAKVCQRQVRVNATSEAALDRGPLALDRENEVADASGHSLTALQGRQQFALVWQLR
jgi:hypothetical protein